MRFLISLSILLFLGLAAVIGCSSGFDSRTDGESAAADSRAPWSPRFLSAMTAQDDKVDLVWAAAYFGGTSVTGYHIYRSTSPGVVSTGTPYATVGSSTLSYTDNDVTNAQIYYYTVVAYGPTGVSAPSNEIWAKPWAPAAPQNTSYLFLDFQAGGGGDGSFATPYNSLTTAITNVAAGGVIVILDSTLTASPAITITKSLTLRSQSGDYRTSAVVFDANGGAGPAFTLDNGVEDVALMGLEVTDYDVGGDSTVDLGTGNNGLRLIMNSFHDLEGPILYAQGVNAPITDIQIYGNRIADVVGTTKSAINIWNTPNCDCDINYNIVDGTTWSGFQFNASNVRARWNDIGAVFDRGIQIHGDSGEVTLEYNFISDVDHNTPYNGDCIGLFDPQTLTDSVTIRYNDLSGCRNGLHLTGATDDLTGQTIIVSGNSFSNNSNAGVEHLGLGTIDLSDNYWGDASGPIHSLNPTGNGDVIDDPNDLITYVSGFLTEFLMP